MATRPRASNRPPAGYRDVHLHGLRAMVSVEDEGLRHARSVVAAVTSAYTRNYATASEARRAATQAGKTIREALSGSLLITRTKAGGEARGFLRKEVDAALKVATKAGDSVDQFGAMHAMLAMATGAVKPADVIRANKAARGFTDSWLEKVRTQIDSREARGSNLGQAFHDASAALDYRVQTAVATETAHAFNAAHEAESLYLVPLAESGWFRRWDATLDGHTCAFCEGMNGSEIPMAQTFAPRPGESHPRCRCVEQLVYRRIPANDVKQPKFEAAPEPVQSKPAFTEGVHAKKVVGKAADLASVLTVVDERTLRFLKRHPLDELAMPARIASDRPVTTNGEYEGTLHKAVLRVAAHRPSDTFGMPWKPGESGSMSTSAKTAVEARRRTFSHELGHHIHMRTEPADAVVAAAFAGGRYLTRYAARNQMEYFAESYSAYVHEPEALKAFDPAGYEMVESVLRMQEILP